jgi:ABC-2 type transport system permease protein
MTLVIELIRAELLKVRTTRTAWGLLGGMVVLVALLVCLTIAQQSDSELKGADGIRSVLTIGGSVAYLFALALGIIGTAGEYRHGTMGHEMLAAPNRWQIVVSKTVAYAIGGFVFAAVALAVTLAIAGPWMSARGVGFAPIDAALPRRIEAGTLIAGALFGMIGVGLGALLKEQVIALLVGVGWTLVVDGVVGTTAPEVGKYFPSGAVTGLLRQSTEDALRFGPAALLGIGYAALFVIAGAIVFQRRDLT